MTQPSTMKLSEESSIYLMDLAEEILKDSPDETKVRNMMEKVGLSYVKDPTERIDTVLKALDRLPRREAML